MSDNLRTQALKLASTMPKGSAERKALLGVLREADAGGVDPQDMKKLDALLNETEHVQQGLMVNYNRQEKSDHEDWYEAMRAYEFAEKRPGDGAAKRLVDRAIASLTKIKQRRPKRGRRASGATFHVYYEEVKNAYVSDVLGQATAILRASGATGFQEGLNVLTFMLGGDKGKIIFFWTGSAPGRLDASVHLVTAAGERRDGHNVFEVMDLDPRGVALKALYLDAKDGKPVFPL